MNHIDCPRVIDRMTVDENCGEASSAAQLRREADKARALAAEAYDEATRLRFKSIASMLEREADEIERTLGLNAAKGRDRPPGWLIAPPFRGS